MPDIIIKGMEMPENCETCFACDYEQGNCLASAERNTLPHNGKRRDWCHLGPADEWIPADKPPRPLERVLFRAGVFVGEGYFTSAHTWRRITGMPIWGITDEPVTHWMPLPEVPG